MIKDCNDENLHKTFIIETTIRCIFKQSINEQKHINRNRMLDVNYKKSKLITKYGKPCYLEFKKALCGEIDVSDFQYCDINKYMEFLYTQCLHEEAMKEMRTVLKERKVVGFTLNKNQKGYIDALPSDKVGQKIRVKILYSFPNDVLAERI